MADPFFSARIVFRPRAAHGTGGTLVSHAVYNTCTRFAGIARTSCELNVM